MTRANGAVLTLLIAAVGIYYHWGVRAAGYDIAWGRDDAGGYYNYLGRAFAGGHLYLPLEPSPQLLAQPDPWDPRVDDSLKLFDAVLFNRRYYLYHGAGPAVMLFAPYRLLTHRDLPENFALFVFCFGGLLFSAGALLRLLRLVGAEPGPAMLGLMLLALGTCQSIPFLLNRVWVYEVAIGGGYFCLAAALFFLMRSFGSPNIAWLMASGLMFGMAVSCRPHLIIAGAIAVTFTGMYSRRRLAALAAPFILVGLAIAIYNYARFGNPLEFGNRYLLGGANQTVVRLSAANVTPGAYYLLFSPPEFSPVFPWVRMPPGPRDFPRPANYTVEPTTGALYLAPFLPAMLLAVLVRRGRIPLWVAISSGVLVWLFIAGTGWSTQRYEVDFLPPAVLGALVAYAAVFGKSRTGAGLLAGLIVAGAIVNLSIAISGPYDEMLQNRPARYVSIARWFSPIARYRPALNPPISIHLNYPAEAPAILFAAGRKPFRYELSVESAGGKGNLISRYHGSTVVQPLETSSAGLGFDIDYSPGSGEMRVSSGGRTILVHRIGTLVAAPAEIEASG